MAEDKIEPRDFNVRQWLPWTHLFRGFWLALDHKKLLLAAAGILVMAFGWWLLSVLFMTREKPSWDSGKYPLANYQPKDTEGLTEEQITQRKWELAWEDFKEDRRHWNLLYETAGPAFADASPDNRYPDAGDLATSLTEYNQIHDPVRDAVEELNRVHGNTPAERTLAVAGREYVIRPKPSGRLRIWPFFENRGPNPLLLVTGQARAWEQPGGFVNWLLRDELPVLIEPLVKFLSPLFYLLSPAAGALDRLYFLLVLAWTILTWAFFGGAITRIAAVEIARNEKIGLGEALRYTLARWRSYLFASFAPLIGIAVITLVLILFGLVNLVPVLAEFWDGLLWWVVLGLGLIMAIVIIGLVGWPLIHATLSAEGSDSFDALSRCYSYVLQKPWSYLWYAAVALVYGAVVVFFVGLMGSLTVYLGKWGVSQTPFAHMANRDPSYLFNWAPTSFGWRDLLLAGSPAGLPHAWNYIGVTLVTFWLYLVFLLIIGFGYSYFWSASTMIYLLMRRKVDDTEMDEVYLEEEDLEEPYSAPAAPTSPAVQPTTTGTTTPLQMVEAPALRTPVPAASPSPPPAPAAVETPAPGPGDGNADTGEADKVTR